MREIHTRIHKLTRARFKEWLDQIEVEHGPDYVIGECRRAYACPVAQFLSTAPNGPHLVMPHVYPYQIIAFLPSIGVTTRNFHIPDWASRLVRHVDKTHSDYDWRVTVQQTREAFEYVTMPKSQHVAK